jgi:hypothetical protein
MKTKGLCACFLALPSSNPSERMDRLGVNNLWLLLTPSPVIQGSISAMTTWCVSRDTWKALL